MNRFAFAILLLLVNVGAFIWVLQPLWADIAAARAKLEDLQSVNNELSAIASRRDQLIQQYNAIPAADLAKVSEIVPQGARNGQLLTDFELISRRNGLALDQLDFSQSSENAPGGLTLPKAAAGQTQTIPFSMVVRGTYGSFRSFLTDLENYVRLTDIRAIQFGASQGAAGVYRFEMKGQVYYQP